MEIMAKCRICMTDSISSDKTSVAENYRLRNKKRMEEKRKFILHSFLKIMQYPLMFS
jgi:hypothetical protein